MKGLLYLHPTHPFWKQFRRPGCPVCHTLLLPKHPVEIEWLPDGRYMVMHAECAMPGEPAMA